MTRFKNNISLPELYDSQLEEKKIIKFWHKQKIFEKIRNARREKNDGNLSFHSAPVFPTGFPHSGHILNGIVKDVFTRYGHQKNLQVNSRFGWDCHGLPVEHEVDKKLGIKSPKDVQTIGVSTYNEECRNLVQRNMAEWKNVSERTGNWIDFTEEYTTMSMEYMESVWWVFKQLFDKGLVYKATKVQPYSTGCFTNLSNFEAEQNCKEVSEIGMNISVDIVDSDEKFLIWTTTPWTLISNSAICVNPKAIYVKVKVNQPQKEPVVYIVSKNRLQCVFKNIRDYTVVDEVLGETLKDLSYKPLFENIPVSKTLRILLDDSVSDDVGTGIVPLDEVLVESLKQRGHIFNAEEVKYKKSFCWRSDTPLIKKKTSSWFIRVQTLVENLLDNNSQVNWAPSNEMKDIHMTQWLKKHSTDWAVSRTRYWGTPLPIWSSESGDEVVCVGSVQELKQLTGKSNIPHLYRECVDWLVIPSRTPGNPPLRRIPEVFDCWFESGAMPFANKHHLAEAFQVDFVAEGIDQTRGWFYTILVLSTALSQPTPYRNMFVTGLVVESDGSKVSKRKHNHNDYTRLIEKYGADTFRLYLLNSPLVQSEKFTIQEEGVANMAKTVIQPLYRIFSKCTRKFASSSWVNYGYVTDWYSNKDTIDINQWMLSCTESLLKFYDDEMKAFRIHTVIPEIIKLLQQIEDWYIPIKYPCSNEQVENSNSFIIFNVIYRLCIVLAPLAPFITEYIYQIYRPYLISWYRKESIHDAPFLLPNAQQIKPWVEVSVSRMQRVVTMVRTLRSRHIIPNQYPIKEIVVIHHRDDYLHDIDIFKDTIMKLVNAIDVRVSKDRHEFGGILKTKLSANSPLSDNQQITLAIQDLSDKDIETLIEKDTISILEQIIPLNNIEISYQFEKELETNYSIFTADDLIVVMKMNKSFFYYEDGTRKQVADRIRNLKKKANYYPSDLATVYYSTKDECLQNLMVKHGDYLNKTTNSELKFSENMTSINIDKVHIEEEVDIKGLQMILHLCINCN